MTPDGKHVVTGSRDHTASIWLLSTGKHVRSLQGQNGHFLKGNHRGEVTSVCVTPDGKHVVTGQYSAAGGSATAHIWLLSKGTYVGTLEGHSSGVLSVCVTPDGKHVVTGSWDNTARIWLLSDGSHVRTLQGHTSVVTSVCVTPDGKHVVTGSWDKTARIWLLSDGSHVRTLEGHTSTVNSVCVTPDGKYVVTGSGQDSGDSSHDNTTRIWAL